MRSGAPLTAGEIRTQATAKLVKYTIPRCVWNGNARLPRDARSKFWKCPLRDELHVADAQ